VLLQCLFLLIFFCNIPFVFFAGKIAMMAVIHQCCFSKKSVAPPTPEEEQALEDELLGSVNQ